jgi:hypothetical protein
MMIKEDAKGLIIENANRFELPEEIKKEIADKRRYFQTEFSKENIRKLDKDHYFQGRGVKQGNFTYELEWNSKCLGGIGGGSVYKFGYEEDFDRIKEVLIKILSAEESIQQFYTSEGDLTIFSKDIVNDIDNLKGVGRVFIGKILSIYFPSIFLRVFRHQDNFLKEIYSDYEPETFGVELYLRNNYLLLDLKNKYSSNLSNDEFVDLLYKIFEIEPTGKPKPTGDEEEAQIEALEVQHYQSLIHRNFERLFQRKLRYYDKERQDEKNGHFDTQEVGVMDFLTLDQNEDLVVIELKRKSTDETLGQTLRYMGWVNKNLCKKNQKVKGIIIAETKDNKLEYALTVTPTVTFRKMTINVEIEEAG